jgi:hypothetical protein
MATNREMLKEAIADAKAVKETAIANAKAALEEAFAPQLKSMLSMKLQEMESEEEEMNEDGFGKARAEGDVGFSTMGEKALDETEDNDADDMMEIDLEELLAELNEEEDMEESLNEAEEEEEEEESEESEEGEEEGEPIELEDMTDEDLKDMIEDVIKDMIASGELEAGHEGGEGEEEGEESEESEEEIDLAELLREIEEMDEMEEPIDELFGIKPGAVRRLDKSMPGLLDKVKAMDNVEDKKAALKAITDPSGEFKRGFDSASSWMSDVSSIFSYVGAPSPFKTSVGDTGVPSPGGANEAMKAELDEALTTIEALKSELNEINLLNAKLLYTNKIFKAKNLNESQKVKVLSSFDKAKNVGEVKMVFETLNEGIKVSKNTIKENLGSASKGTMTPNVKKPIVESNEAFLRMQKLAGII